MLSINHNNIKLLFIELFNHINKSIEIKLYKCNQLNITTISITYKRHLEIYIIFLQCIFTINSKYQ